MSVIRSSCDDGRLFSVEESESESCMMESDDGLCRVLVVRLSKTVVGDHCDRLGGPYAEVILIVRLRRSGLGFDLGDGRGRACGTGFESVSQSGWSS